MGQHQRGLSRERVAVVGRGLTAYACAAALSQLEIQCDLYLTDEGKGQGPPLILNDICLDLLDEFFPGMDWFRKMGRPLHTRHVLWGNEKREPVVAEGMAIGTGSLIRAVSAQLEYSPFIRIIQKSSGSGIGRSKYDRSGSLISGDDQSNNDPNTFNHSDYSMVLDARPPGFAIGLDQLQNKVYQAGERIIHSLEVTVGSDAEQDAVYMESLDHGWAFLAPTQTGSWTLQVMALPGRQTSMQKLGSMLEGSRMIGQMITQYQVLKSFPAAPRIQIPLSEPSLLRVGPGAVKLDPVSGEGTPFALRTALLARATLSGMLKDPTQSGELLGYYQDRIALSYLSHLKGCVRLYHEALGNKPAWQAEIGTMDQAVRELGALFPKTADDLKYRLTGEGLELVC